MEQLTEILQVKQDEMIDRYLQNKMTVVEEADFEMQLRTDAALRSRARFIAKTIKAMKSTTEEGLTIAPSTGYRMVAKNPWAKNKKK